MQQKKIERINELARKAKAGALTPEETAERAALRAEYLADIKASLRSQLENTYVQTEDGAKIPYAEYAKQEKEAAAAAKPQGGNTVE